MLLSILIPTYNQDCTNLVKDLSNQLPDDSEIIVGDDGSTDENIRQHNRTITAFRQCHLWESQKNLGRATMRNRLAERAQGEWLLFIDSDASVKDNKFLSHYLDHLDANVINGGTSLPDFCPTESVSLRYKYEKDYWDKHRASKREKAPYKSFTTFNFLIRKNTFMKIKFNESITTYGHEDTLLGRDLKANNIKILHIDNPLIHIGLEPNAEYLGKVECSLQSLKDMQKELYETSTLLKMVEKLNKFNLMTIIRVWHKVFGKIEKKNLLSARPSLMLFKLYKLGYFSNL